MIDHCTLELTDDKASALGRGPVYPRQARQAIKVSELPIRLDRSASLPLRFQKEAVTFVQYRMAAASDPPGYPRH
jgi:hypothetical protein